MPTKQTIVLIGPMGAGKTTIGRLLSSRTHLPFYDSDSIIVEQTGVSIPTIFEMEGEIGFRARETKALSEIGQKSPMVLATGGGSVIKEENRKILKAMGCVVFLDLSVEEQIKRTRRDTNRPLLQVDDPKAKLQELRRQRLPLYRETADIILQTDRMRAPQVVGRILHLLKERKACKISSSI